MQDTEEREGRKKKREEKTKESKVRKEKDSELKKIIEQRKAEKDIKRWR